MNIFVLDEDPIVSANDYNSKHQVKMVLELAQQLSTAHHLCGSNTDLSKLYKATHVHHPCVKWVCETTENYKWAYEHFVELCNAFERDFGKTHKTSRLIEDLKTIPNIPQGNLTPFAQAMDDVYKSTDPVISYWLYYVIDKDHLAQWKNKEIPYWYEYLSEFISPNIEEL